MACFFLFFFTNEGLSQEFIRATEISSYPGAYPYGLAEDENGNLLFCGDFRGEVDMDMSPDAEALITAGSKSNIYIAKYKSNGNYLWAFSLGGEKSVAYSAIDIGADKEGNIFICGGSRGWIDFDPTEETDSVWTGGNMIYLAKYGPDGEYIWAIGIGFESRNAPCYPYSLVVDTLDGSVYVSGHLNGQMDFDPSEGTALLGSGPYSDMFLAKYSKDGDYLWANVFTNSGEYRNCRPEALAIDSEGNIVIGGNFDGWYDMDPSNEVQLMTQHKTDVYSGSDVFLASYDRDGNYRWHLNAGSGYANYVRSLKFHEGKIFAVGAFMDTVDFDPSENSYFLESAEMEMSGYLAVYNPDGSFQNAIGMRGLKGEYSDSQSEIHDVAFDGQGKCYVIGQFAGTIDCDPTEGNVEITSTGGVSDYDMLLAQYDLDLNYQWAIHAGGNSQEVGLHTVVTDSGEVMAHGYFDGDCDFDPSDAEKWMFNSGGHDLFMAWYFAYEPVGVHQEVSSNENRKHIYPNPFNTHLNIDHGSEIISIKIYTASGKLVSFMDISSMNTRLDLSGLTPAYYLLRIESEDAVENHRIIKLE